MKKQTVAGVQERAELLAEKLLGTQDILESLLEESEMNDEDLLNAIFGKIACCVDCGTWVETGETDSGGLCLDCPVGF